MNYSHPSQIMSVTPMAEEKTEHSGEVPEVVFSHVGLTYAGAGEESLTDIDFTVKKGETVGIIGGTGSGKSTLVNLIPRFYDATKGEVLVNGTNVKEYTEEGLRNKIGIVPQKAVLFKGTIRSNLLWGNENANESDLMEALKQAQGYDFVMQKENGIDSVVEQNGRNFSGGQRQRLTIARALVRKPEILILDDSSSALDYTTDANLRREIAKLKDMTVFIVSQRTASIMDADQIVVLDDGNIMGIGTHKELLEKCEVYKEIYESQFKKPEKEEMLKMKEKTLDSKSRHLEKVIKHIKKYWYLLGGSLFFALVYVALSLYVPIQLGNATDLILGRGKVDFTEIGLIAVKIAAFTLIAAFAQWIMNNCNNKITYNVVRDIREETFEHLQKLPLKYIDSHSNGETVSKIITDVDQLADGLLMGFFSVIYRYCYNYIDVSIYAHNKY